MYPNLDLGLVWLRSAEVVRLGLMRVWIFYEKERQSLEIDLGFLT